MEPTTEEMQELEADANDAEEYSLDWWRQVAKEIGEDPWEGVTGCYVEDAATEDDSYNDGWDYFEDDQLKEDWDTRPRLRP